MPQLAAAAPYIGLVMAGASAVNQAEAGKAAEANAKLLALQDERDANAVQVEAQQLSAQERRKARFLRSRAIAVAGASGGGVDDPTVQNILTDIDTQGEMNALNTLYGGDIEARALRTHARAQRAEGTALRGNAYGQAGATALSGALTYGSQIQAPSFFSKYGGSRAQSIGTGTGFSDFAGQPHSDEWVA
jgi:hypothetical protein